MIIRDDIHGEPLAPKELREYIARVGGKNPFGEPLYRLVHTSTRYTKQGGNWHDWDENLSIQERGGMIPQGDGTVMTLSPHKPKRIVLEVREVLKYPAMDNRWVLERWCPASFYGTQSNWEMIRPKGADVPLLGPYPADGDHEFVAGPAESLPTHTFIKNAIDECERLKDQHSEHLDTIVRERVAEAQFRHEEVSREHQEFTEKFIKDQLSPWTSTSLEAGRWRQGLADKAGVKEWAGA